HHAAPAYAPRIDIRQKPSMYRAAPEFFSGWVFSSESPMDTTSSGFVRAGNLEELKAKGRIVVHGRHRPVLLVHEGARVFALDNGCPYMGFPLEGGRVEDGILPCHWHHARFELASGCTFDLWADDVPTCPVEIRADGEIWVKPLFGYADQAGH